MSNNISYPTLQQINHHQQALRDQLALLRILNASDLAFHFMLYNDDTITDIIKVSKELFEQDKEQTDSELSAEEQSEYLEYIYDMEG